MPAARTLLPCSRLVLSQTKVLRLPVDYAHLFDFAEEKYSQIQCQLCACHLPAETCDCVWPDAAAEGLTTLKSEAQSSRQRSCIDSVCGQDLHSFGERQRRRAGLHQELFRLDLQEEVSSFWQQLCFGPPISIQHPTSGSCAPFL